MQRTGNLSWTQTIVALSVLGTTTLEVSQNHMSSDAYVGIVGAILGAVLGVSVGAASAGNGNGK